MKRNFITTLLIMPLVLGSCGDSSENAQTEASETNSSETAALVEKVENRKIPHASFKISNMDKGFFKLTDDAEAELVIGSNGGLEVSCEFEVVKTFTGKAKYNQVFVSATALDENGKTIEMSTVMGGEMRTDDSDGSQFLDFMMGEPGSKAMFTFTGAKNKEGSWEVDASATKDAVSNIESFKILTDR
ncbi:MAG: hypothetical protein QNL43_10660 [Crocinitomicaceae bacterium]|jgi:hypothetical protein|tara:strand:- start:1966 stop:2529 length:564 start_codon:yes stop_codon:yes gene_type:complete